MNSFNLKVITPDGIKYNDQVICLETTTTNGRIGVYANHTNLIALLKPNIFSLKEKNNKYIKYAITSGYLFFENNEAKILTNYFEDINNINKGEINQQIITLKDQLSSLKETDTNYAMIKFQIKKYEDILKAISKQ